MHFALVAVDVSCSHFSRHCPKRENRTMWKADVVDHDASGVQNVIHYRGFGIFLRKDFNPQNNCETIPRERSLPAKSNTIPVGDKIPLGICHFNLRQSHRKHWHGQLLVANLTVTWSIADIAVQKMPNIQDSNNKHLFYFNVAFLSKTAVFPYIHPYAFALIAFFCLISAVISDNNKRGYDRGKLSDRRATTAYFATPRTSNGPRHTFPDGYCWSHRGCTSSDQ